MIVSSHYHTPVLLNDSVNGLNIIPNGVYVDATFGGGGHSREILNRLSGGKLFGVDQDADVEHNVIDDPRFELLRSNFRYLKNRLRLHGVKQVDGILADLGVSGHQLDEGDRGFSFRFEGDLDMRMDRNQTLSASTVINDYRFEDLVSMFRRYGEVENPSKLTRAIIQHRELERIDKTSMLKEVALTCAGPKKQSQYLSKVFQAIRIEVNDELKVLEELLLQSVEIIKPGGRLVLIAYHSLEDRIAKRFLRSGNFEGIIEKDFYGNDIKPFKSIGKAIKASEKEIEINPRSRSARLRIGERINEQKN